MQAVGARSLCGEAVDEDALWIATNAWSGIAHVDAHVTRVGAPESDPDGRLRCSLGGVDRVVDEVTDHRNQRRGLEGEVIGGDTVE